MLRYGCKSHEISHQMAVPTAIKSAAKSKDSRMFFRVDIACSFEHP